MESNVINYTPNNVTNQILADARHLGLKAGTSLDDRVRTFLTHHREEWFKLQESREAR